MGGLKMAQHDVEITITKTGEVKVHVKGAKGKACLNYTKWFQQLVGKVKSQTMTSEFYEPDVKSRIDVRHQVHEKDRE
jgi:hypothetical protein